MDSVPPNSYSDLGIGGYSYLENCSILRKRFIPKT